jgi:hypothetical protein
MQAALKTLSDQLAAAIAANDPVGNAALQSQIDAMQAALDAEIAKVAALLASVGPTGGTGPTGDTGTTGPVDPGASGPTGTDPATTA